MNKELRPKSGCYAFVMYVIWCNVIIWVLMIGIGVYIFFNRGAVSNGISEWFKELSKAPASSVHDSSDRTRPVPTLPDAPKGK